MKTTLETLTLIVLISCFGCDTGEEHTTHHSRRFQRAPGVPANPSCYDPNVDVVRSPQYDPYYGGGCKDDWPPHMRKYPYGGTYQHGEGTGQLP